MKHALLVVLAIQLVSCYSRKSSNTYDNHHTGMRAAKEKNCAVLVIFDVYGSSTDYVDDILQDEKIATALNKNIVIRLKCDDKRKFCDSLSVGQYNSNLQKELTGEYYQPMFCVLDQNGKKIASTLGHSEKSVVEKYLKKALSKTESGI